MEVKGTNLNKKVVNATKWSAITEIFAKLFMPISGLILARLLTPEAFGIVATLTMIISFADILSDAGFHKYIVQHDFSDKDELNKNASVAFWSNQTISFAIWIIIALFRHPLATLVGSPGYGNVLLIACANIPLVGFSSIQTGLFKRNLDFKTLFKVRVCTTLVPLLVTIPLAFMLRSFWALVIGTLAKNFFTSALLLYHSSWKPSFFYSFKILKEMLSFSIWSMVETLAIWLNQYADVFFIGALMTQYYLGLYKTSLSIVGQIIGLVTSVLTPVIFSTLSRLQNDDKAFRQMFFNFQKVVAILILPMGFLIYAEKELVTNILIGSQWLDASEFIGLWGLMGGLSVATTRYCSEMYRAKGKPMLCFLSQILMFVVLVPGIIITAKIGFREMTLFRSLLELEFVLVNLVITYLVFKISPFNIILNIKIPLIASLIAFAMVCVLKPINESVVYQIAICCLAAVIYLGIVALSHENRELIQKYLLKRKKHG